MEIKLPKGLDRAMAQVLANEAALATRLGVDEAPHIPPAEKFYHSNYILDGCVAAEICIAAGYHRKGANQLNSFRDNQRPDGMVPGVSHPPTNFSINPERWLSTAPFVGNDYTQTPDWARLVMKLVETASQKLAVTIQEDIDADIFLADIYPSLKRYYDYLNEHRRLSKDDPRVFLLHPHEANRDSAPEYDEWKRQQLRRALGRGARLLKGVPRTGEHMPKLVNHFNRSVDYMGAIAINAAGRLDGWNPAKIRRKNLFIDVWFNCHLVENYWAMADAASWLGQVGDAAHFRNLAIELEQAMAQHYDPMARSGKGGYYSSYNGELQYVETIGNLSALLLPNSGEQEINSIVSLMDQSFTGPFVVPCVAFDEITHFDPHYEELNSHWGNGAVWGVANAIMKRAFEKHIDRQEEISDGLRERCQDWQYAIDTSDKDLIEQNDGYAESYSQKTGKGQRTHKTRGHIFGAIGDVPLSALL